MKPRRRNPQVCIDAPAEITGATLRFASGSRVKLPPRAPPPAAAPAPKKPRAKRSKKHEPDDILASIIRLGGIDYDDAVRLWGAMVKDAVGGAKRTGYGKRSRGSRRTFGHVFRKHGGKSVDAIARELSIEGFLRSEYEGQSTDHIRELEEKVGAALAGEKVQSGHDSRYDPEALSEHAMVDAARRGDPGAQAELELRGIAWNPTAKKRRRRNPDLVTVLGNPAPKDLPAAARAYREFHGVDPATVVELDGPKDRVLVALGELREVVYQPRRGERKGPAFFHRFGRGAVLAATPDGKHLVIVPAGDVKRGRRSARVDWSRGIVG